MKIKRTIFILVLGSLSALPGFAQVKDTLAYHKPLFDFDYDKPVFELDSSQLHNQNRFLRFIALSGYREGVEQVHGGWTNWEATVDQEHGTTRFYWINLSIQDILTNRFSPNIPYNHVILEVREPSKYRYDPSYGDKTDWMRKNAWCIELMLPYASSQDFSKTLNEQLAQAFQVKFSNKKRMVNSLVLVRTSQVDKLKSAGGPPVNGDKGVFRNTSVKWLGPLLDKAGMPPFSDESGYAGAVDMNLNIKDWTDLAALRKALQSYDLDLKEEPRMQDMVVITEIAQNK
ncbi:DUF3738 domain-containing protein [Mucilaginibacter sp. UR6-11]|uniref:DUF3738 domain-containing protein n=1 Tax=Mucilaginibacter sp. UR6-11 TaxID=1435644 RepID=UPI001E2A52E8|nr:DUF3738 domain-containing protein [Mucilaginibacter sp. UR6-11]MCC8423592.1 DUF3738 domain-containing protein [Mucilaginibacter sp. UR6-11]